MLWAALVSAAATGCSGEEDLTISFAGGSGGNGGTVSVAGAAGSATAGSGGTTLQEDAGGSDLDAGVVSFRVTRAGNRLRVEATGLVSYVACTGELLALTGGEAGAWQPIRDERPDYARHDGFFLDGSYVPAACSLGCDASYCALLSTRELDAREYIVGGAPQLAPASSYPPDDFCTPVPGGDGGVREVPSFSSRLPLAPQAVRIRYYADNHCGSNGSAIGNPDALREVIVEAQ